MKKWHRLWEQHHTWAGIVISGTLVTICYGFALQLPFFFDDLPVMTWLNHQDWANIWTTSTGGAYYRPLTFTAYKLGLLFPQGARQIVLHAVSLLVYWGSAILVMQVVKLLGKSPKQALLASILFVVFPFMFLAVPWITSLPHHLATALTLFSVYAALKAERDDTTGWWGLSLLATTLAPFAHESGQMCAVIVGGVVIIQYGIRSGRRRIVATVLGGALSVGAFLLRNHIPGVGEARPVGLQDWLQNTMFFLHGLLYPVAPIIGRLVHHHGANDFTLIKIATASLCLLLIWLAHRSRDWRHVACNLWWWACAALPAAVSFRYGGLYISPRLYALASAGIVMLWAYVIIELGKMVRSVWGRRLVWALLAGVIVTQNTLFIYRERSLFVSLNSVYQRVLEAAKDRTNAPLGFVNLPSYLAWPQKTHALIQESVTFIPPYSNVGEFIEVNEEWRASDAVVYTPVLKDTEEIFKAEGPGLDWEQMRQFAIDHSTIWLTRYHEGQFVLNHVGMITADARPVSTDPLVRFEGGPVIESAAAQKTHDGRWAVTITWLASGPVDGKIFVHVRDASNNLVVQANGPTLGGMVPPWIWRSGDRISDVRHFALPEDAGPYTVQVGVYNSDGRFPAFMGDSRCQDDAAPVVIIAP
ncbi:MAG: hypothetical protein IMY86_12340 [Chloroflexi bacterium]|nr:hypothetical protein [Chloroflexota bacterium]